MNTCSFKVGRCLLVAVCASPSIAQPANDSAALNELRKWREQRERSLRSKNGYLALVGLYWLKDGRHAFGSAPENDIVFPKGRAPAHAGHIQVDGKTVTVVSAPDVMLTVNGKQVSRIELVSDGEGEPTRVQLGELTFWLIQRSGLRGIRLRDPQSPILRDYKGTQCFPYAPKWRMQARFEPPSSQEPIRVLNVMGKATETKSEGRLTFEVDGMPYSLHPTSANDTELFIILGDKTNGPETYGGGRFLRVPRPSDGDATMIDFNRAYNPPCAYSPFTTCLLAPKENTLPIRVDAGETTEGIRH